MPRQVIAVLAVLVAVNTSLVESAPPPAPAPATSLAGPSPPPAPRGAPSDAPSPSPAASAFPPLPAGTIPILYLHRVEAPPPDWGGWKPSRRAAFLRYDDIPAAFEAQLDWLRSNGYTTILPRDLADHWDHGTPLPPRPVIISLDDGWPSWMTEILPALRARGMVAEFYLTLDAIADRRLTWADVRELAAAGMGIGAHGVHHVQLAALGPSTRPVSPRERWSEVNDSRVIIGREIGAAPDSMAYVGGGFDAELESLVATAGYTTARSIIRGTEQTASERYALRVVAIRPHDDVLDIETGTLVDGLPTFASKLGDIPP